MARKTLQVHLRVSERQRASMREKADLYGIPLSRLVLLAVEAYVRTYGLDASGDHAVAVNYGVWSSVDCELGSIERLLRESAQQLVGLRMMLVAWRKAGTLGAERYEVALATLREVRDGVAAMREDVRLCTEALDAVSERASLVDPFLGPLEGAPAAPGASGDEGVTGDDPSSEGR